MIHAWIMAAALTIAAAVPAAAQQAPDGDDACLGRITGATYAAPVTRYGHDVLGGGGEWERLVIGYRGGGTCGQGTINRAYRLPESLVFEDIAPRLADLDGDGANEIVMVESSLTRGARLVVWGNNGAGHVRRLAATPHIGTRNRWLAPFPPADLDGDGRMELAYIDRPHLAKTLRIWRYEGDRLTEIASAPGLSNHRIGWDYIAGGVRDCGQGAEIVTASGDWARLIAARLDESRIVTRDLGPWSRAAERNAMACR